MNETIPFYVINEPYELFYKNSTSSFPVGAHTHNAAELYLTLTDLPDVLLNDTVSKVSKGTLILIPPFCIHQLYHEKNVKYERYILNLDIPWLENVLHSKQELTENIKNSDQPMILPLSPENLTNLTTAMNNLLPIINERSIKSTADFFAMLSVLDFAIQSSKENVSVQPVVITKSQKLVNDIIAYINNHLNESIALADIASHFYMNKDYLSRLFMKHTHTSIGRYIIIQRISKAQELLRAGMTVIQVSENLGFSSYAYFFKLFKKMTGISPSQYRKEHGDIINPPSFS